MHVLRADCPTVDLPEQGDDIAQAHAVRGIQRAGVEDLIQIRCLQLVIGQVQIRDLGGLAQPQGVQVGDLVTTEAITVDQPQDRCLFFRRRRLQPLGGSCQRPTRLSWARRRKFRRTGP